MRSPVLVLSDDEAVHSRMRVALASAELELAFSVETELSGPPHLAIVDSASVQFVAPMQAADPLLQVLLLTAESPNAALLALHDVHACASLNDDGERLHLITVSLLRQRAALARVVADRQSLLHITHISPRLTKLQPMQGLFQLALHALAELLGPSRNGGGVFVYDGAPEGRSIRAATGCFTGVEAIEALDPATRRAIELGFACEGPFCIPRTGSWSCRRRPATESVAA